MLKYIQPVGGLIRLPAGMMVLWLAEYSYVILSPPQVGSALRRDGVEGSAS